MQYFKLVTGGFGIQRWIPTDKRTDTNSKQVDLYRRDTAGKIVLVGKGYY